MDTTPQQSRTDHNVWAAIFADDPLALRAWLVGIGFEEGIVRPDEDGVGRVMVSTRATKEQEWEGVGRVSLYVVTADPAAVHERAVAAGATITRPLKNESDYESRGFSCTDPEGNHWSFGTYAG